MGITRRYSRLILHYIKYCISHIKIIFSLLPSLQFEMLTNFSYSLHIISCCCEATKLCQTLCDSIQCCM